MRKSEKIISALLMMVLGVMFIILKDKFIGLLMTVAGISLIVLGMTDLVERLVPPAVIKIVSGILVIICGWLVVEAVLYILAGILLVLGILLLYDQIKNKEGCDSLLKSFLQYAVPIICIAIGILLLFHRGNWMDIVLIISGCLIFVEGAIVLFNAWIED